MLDGSHRKLALVNAERGISLAEMNVSSPQLLGIPVADVGPQQVAALAVPGPFVPLRSRRPLETNSRWPGGILNQVDQITPCGACVALEEPANLAFQLAPVEPPARMLEAPDELFQTLLDALGKAPMDRLLLLAPLQRAPQPTTLLAVVSAPHLPLHPFPPPLPAPHFAQS